MKKITEKVKTFIDDNVLLYDGARVVVGLSGGPDSVALLRIMHQLDYDIIAVHCNFHLRKEESNRDELFALELCKSLGIKCLKVDFDTQNYAKEHGISIEMAARDLRYDYFRTAMNEHDCEAIAVGHHMGDNVETMLLNIIRGTGIQGACAIQPKNNDIIRPLLCLTREEILEYLNSIGQSYVTDHTNLINEYSRNKVRLDVLPIFETINQGALSNIATTIENLNEARKVYNASIKQSIAECCYIAENGDMYIRKENLTMQPSPLSLLHELLSPMHFNREQIKMILNTLDSIGKVYSNPEGKRLLIDRNDLIVESQNVSAMHIEMNTFNIEDIDIIKDVHYAYLDADKLKGKLEVRTVKEGDTFAPFGMGGKRKLISDFLTNLKLNRFEKEKQPLLCDGEEVAWVIGLRSSELYRIDDSTKRVIQCQVSWRK